MTNDEDKEFEEARKNVNTLGLKKSLREQGIDTKKLAMYKLDEIRRAIDRWHNVQNKYNPMFRELQEKNQKVIEEHQKLMNDLNAKMQAEVEEARKEVDRLILQIKADQQLKQPPSNQEQVEPKAEQQTEPSAENKVES